MPTDVLRKALRLLLLVSALGSLLALRVSAGPVKTLTRFHDPVVISASALPGMAGRSTAGMVLCRLRHNRLEIMPYEFDARDQAGDIDVSVGTDFVLDDNDELVFMAKDTGDRAEANDLAGAAGFEIAVDDPRDGGQGWAYLLPASVHAAAVSSAPYVYFDSEQHRARSDLYEVEYADGRNFLTGLRVAPAAGGRGENLLRQTRMLGEPTFSLLFGNVQLAFTERNSIVRVDGVRNGRVRSVRRVHLAVDLGPLFPDLPTGTVYTFHYFSSFSTPTQMSIPWMALKLLRDFRFENVIEFAPGAAPQRYWDAANPRGRSLASDHDDAIATDHDHDWWAVSGTTGSFLQAFILPPEWIDWGITRGTVVQRPPAAAPSGAGFTLRDMTRLKHSGAYQLMQATVVLPGGYRPGDDEQVMAMFHAPLRVEVQPLPAVPAGQKQPVLSRAPD